MQRDPHRKREPFEDCPQYSHCSTNRCPLDPERDKRVDLEGEPKCPLGKTRRMRIAAQYPKLIPWRGLWPRELAARLRWEAMSEAEQEAVREAARKRCPNPFVRAPGK